MKPTYIEVWAKHYSPVFDPKATKWRFDWGDGQKYVDMSETKIADEIMKRRQIGLDDLYRLKIELTQTLGGAHSALSISYKAVDVLDFKPGEQQMELFRQ